MTSIKTRQLNAGYLKSNQTPTCSNCIAKENEYCLYHEFSVGLSSWCPRWMPNNNWITANQSALSIIKDKNDLQQQAAEKINDLTRHVLQQQTIIHDLRQKIQ